MAVKHHRYPALFTKTKGHSFITSDKASFLTGQTIAIDGGVTAT